MKELKTLNLTAKQQALLDILMEEGMLYPDVISE